MSWNTSPGKWSSSLILKHELQLAHHHIKHLRISTLDHFYTWDFKITNFLRVTWDFSQSHQSQELHSIVYWSPLSLREALVLAGGSLITLTLRLTHGTEAAASQHLPASVNTFPASVPLPPFSTKSAPACKWAMSAHAANPLSHFPLLI